MTHISQTGHKHIAAILCISIHRQNNVPIYHKIPAIYLCHKNFL